VNGLQRVRPGAQVQAQHVAMGEPSAPQGKQLLAGATAAQGGTENTQ